MDDLLKIASGVMENFNPAVDSADDYEDLKDGEYSCMLEEVKDRVSAEKGTKWISLQFRILEGEYADRFLFVNYFFTEKTTERSIKGLIKLAHEFGYELPLEAFTDMSTLSEALTSLEGTNATVKQTTSKSGFANHKVTPVA